MFDLLAATAVMLTVIQAPFKLGWLAWFALVPFIYACKKDENTWRIVIVSYIAGTAYWLGNLYWIGYVTAPGYVLLSLSLGLYWPVLGLFIRFFRRTGFPLVLGVPFVFVGAEAWQGTLYTGFNWRLLGHSQWQALPVIQIADIFGTLGISFVIAMVNGLIAMLVIDYVQGRKKKLLRSINFISTSAVLVILAAVIMYGNKRISETPDCITKGPLVGSVQPNVPSFMKELSEAGDQILDDLMKDSQACFDAGALLTIWPETMVLTTINREYVELCKEGTRPAVYDETIGKFTENKGYVLLGAHSVDINTLVNDISLGDRYNSAFLYTPAGKQFEKRYDKIHLVPYGEYIPFKETFPPMHKLGVLLSPYDYDYSLGRGDEYTTFEISAGENNYRFGVLICYEDTDPQVTRKMVVDDKGNKKADWLVNISNDGWYVRYKEEKVLPSVELSQRTVITIFRAIENRISIIRSVNTGISCVIDSVGRIRDGFVSGTLPKTALDRQGVAGWLVDNIDIDERVTFFSLHGLIVKNICAVVFAIMPILCLVKRMKFKTNL